MGNVGECKLSGTMTGPRWAGLKKLVAAVSNFYDIEDQSYEIKGLIFTTIHLRLFGPKKNLEACAAELKTLMD